MYNGIVRSFFGQQVTEDLKDTAPQLLTFLVTSFAEYFGMEEGVDRSVLAVLLDQKGGVTHGVMVVRHRRLHLQMGLDR